jgi:hypothetical protein
MYRRVLLVALGSVAGLAAILLGAFTMYRWTSQGQILGAVTVNGVSLGGMPEEEAILALIDMEQELASRPLEVRVNGSAFDLVPVTVGFDVDEQAIVEGAMQIGREGSTWSQFRWWLSSFGSSYSIPLLGSLDPKALNQAIDRWEVDSGMELPFDGAITLEDLEPVAQYPRPGMGIDRIGVAKEVLDTLLAGAPPVVTLPVDTLEPALTKDDIDRALAHARKLLSGPVVLERDDPDVRVTFSFEVLAGAFFALVIGEPEPRVELGFDTNAINRYLNAIREDLEAPPRDAQLVVDENDQVNIVPSRPGTLIDPDLATRAIKEAAATFARTGEFPFEDGAEPEVTTADLEALGVKHLVSAFTTYHRCCRNRVKNIHLFADEIDGALVLPGETFSLNEYAGPRTAAEGYVLDGTIIGGVLQDQIGGGVSQFATTFYNAVFWGGYEDVIHKPHSLYFTRYPVGIEATISWPAPNLIFRNDTDAAILIKTEYTDTSITVKFFSDNGGRAVVGEQQDGKTIITVVSEGVGARIVEAELSSRYNFRDPKTRYEPDDTLPPGEEHVEKAGSPGWSVDVTRTITYPDGRVEKHSWTVHYAGPFRIIRVHPCMIPEGFEGYTGEECPEETEETTTTITTTTTTTTPTPTTAP